MMFLYGNESMFVAGVAIGIVAALIAVLFMQLHKSLNRLLMMIGLHVSF